MGCRLSRNGKRKLRDTGCMVRGTGYWEEGAEHSAQSAGKDELLQMG